MGSLTSPGALELPSGVVVQEIRLTASAGLTEMQSAERSALGMQSATARAAPLVLRPSKTCKMEDPL